MLKNPLTFDYLGAVSSGVCLAHCLATPFLFAAHTSAHAHHGDHPLWWGFIDVLFLGISCFAIYFSIKNTTLTWIKYAFAASWLFLFLIIFNEKIEGIHLVEEIIYAPAFSLIFLHLYNRKYCKCEDEECCTVD